MPDLLVLQNPNSDKVTSVAYLDQHMNPVYDESLIQRVHRMVRKQMKEMSSDGNSPKDYLAEKLPMPKLPKLESPWFQAEINRVVEAQQNGDKKGAKTSAANSEDDVEMRTVESYA